MLTLFACTYHRQRDNSFPPSELKAMLNDTLLRKIEAKRLTEFHVHLPLHGNLYDEKAAVKYAEDIVSQIYGKENIRGERPYHLSFTEGYWFMEGDLPEGWHGGVFSILFSAKDGKVIWEMHDK